MDASTANVSADILTFTGAPTRALAVDAEGGVWVATGGGLAYRAADGTLTLYTRDNGLLSNDVRSLAIDGEGNVYELGNRVMPEPEPEPMTLSQALVQRRKGRR